MYMGLVYRTPYLLVERLVMLKERLERLQDFHLAADACRVGRVAFDDGHAQRTFVSRDETLEVLEQQLQPRHHKR